MKTDREKAIDRIFSRMTDEERMELLCRSMTGFCGYDVQGHPIVMMGAASLKRLQEYQDTLIKKYE